MVRRTHFQTCTAQCSPSWPSAHHAWCVPCCSGDGLSLGVAKAADNSVMISSIGFLSNLANLIISPLDSISPLSGVDLVAKKVRGVAVMGGGYLTHPEFGGEWNFAGGGSPDACCSNPPCPIACTTGWTNEWYRNWPAIVPIMFSVCHALPYVVR